MIFFQVSDGEFLCGSQCFNTFIWLEFFIFITSVQLSNIVNVMYFTIYRVAAYWEMFDAHCIVIELTQLNESISLKTCQISN